MDGKAGAAPPNQKRPNDHRSIRGLRQSRSDHPPHSRFDGFLFEVSTKHSGNAEKSNNQYQGSKKMSTAVPTSTQIVESSLIPAHLSQVWHLIKLSTFHTFWTALKSTEEVKGASPETDIVKWTFKDGTVQEVKQEEHSALNHFITYSIISSTPALSYTASYSTIRLFEVTSGPHAGGTFIQWTANFSGDADAGVVEDAKFKRREALADLEKAVVGKGHGKST